jgi:hypothetical protein
VPPGPRPGKEIIAAPIAARWMPGTPILAKVLAVVQMGPLEFPTRSLHATLSRTATRSR